VKGSFFTFQPVQTDILHCFHQSFHIIKERQLEYLTSFYQPLEQVGHMSNPDEQTEETSVPESAPLLGNGHAPQKSAALKFVLMVGCMSFFADFTYEGSRSIIGQYLSLLGLGPAMISFITGFGEFLGYGLRLLSSRAADRTGLYWPITIGGYLLQMTVVPLLAIARDWRVAALLIILERVGKAIRNPPRDAMLAHAGKQIGYGWGFGVHEALDQFGALFGPLFVSLILSKTDGNYVIAFACLAGPAAIMLFLLLVARLLYPRPQDLEGDTAFQGNSRLPKSFWIYLVAVAMVAAGFADFPLIAYRFQLDRTMASTLIPLCYGAALAVAGAASLLFGRAFDRFGIGILVPLTLLAAFYAPMVFKGAAVLSFLGALLWGLGMGVHESIIPAAVATMVTIDRRASAYGLFTGVYGVAWLVGSVAIGALFNVSRTAVIAFTLAIQFAAVPFIWAVWQLMAREH
jgi:predicted MFS family arabinose efflux permease